MTSDELTKSQAAEFSTALFPDLARLRKRMQKAGFSSDDNLFKLVEKAHEAMQHLVAEARYLSRLAAAIGAVLIDSIIGESLGANNTVRSFPVCGKVRLARLISRGGHDDTRICDVSLLQPRCTGRG